MTISNRIWIWSGVALLGAALLAVLILAGNGGSSTSQGEESGAGEQTFPIQGQDHIVLGASHPPYNSNPPTSGWHYAQPAGWGFYQEALPDEQVVHNLEHGGIWVSYKDVDDATRSELELIARQNPTSVIVTPRAGNDALIAVASWGKLLKLESFDKARIQRFIDSNKNKSPEPLAR